MFACMPSADSLKMQHPLCELKGNFELPDVYDSRWAIQFDLKSGKILEFCQSSKVGTLKCLLRELQFFLKMEYPRLKVTVRVRVKATNPYPHRDAHP